MTTWDERMRSTPPKLEPRLQLLEIDWVLRGPSGRALTCALYQVASGLELRASYPGDDLVRSELVGDRARGRALARDWMHTIIERHPHDFEVLEALPPAED